MNLGDVTALSVPKLTLVSAPQSGGAIATRTFIPHRCHASIGVLGAVSVATACVLTGSVCDGIAAPPDSDGTVSVEETRLTGMSDHLVLPLSHFGLVLSYKASEAVVHFLQEGNF